MSFIRKLAINLLKNGRIGRKNTNPNVPNYDSLTPAATVSLDLDT